MNELGKNITEIAMAIVGVAILAVLVMQGNNTVGVISSAGNAFSGALATAMTGHYSGGGNVMPMSGN